jgi:hypothetical protein
MQQLLNALGPEASRYVVWVMVSIAILIGLMLVIWGVMRIFGSGLNMGSGGRGQQPQRLGITGAYNVDRKGRRLVIVRRDNVEHLILIGGPNDVLVESNIIRAAERATTRPSANLPTAQEPVAAPVAVPAIAPAPVVPVTPPPMPVAPPAPAPRPAPPVVREPVLPPVESRPSRPEPVVTPPAPRSVTTEPLRAPIAPSPALKAPPSAPPVPPATIPSPAVATPDPAPGPAPVATPAPPRPADPRLSDMAKRLQSVLRTPLTPVNRAADPAAAAKAETIPIPLPSARAAEPQPEPPQLPQGKPVSPTPPKPDTSAIDSLEEEMARLLGRSGPDKR